jgi:hypothetical protein
VAAHGHHPVACRHVQEGACAVAGGEFTLSLFVMCPGSALQVCAGGSISYACTTIMRPCSADFKLSYRCCAAGG